MVAFAVKQRSIIVREEREANATPLDVADLDWLVKISILGMGRGERHSLAGLSKIFWSDATQSFFLNSKRKM